MDYFKTPAFLRAAAALAIARATKDAQTVAAVYTKGMPSPLEELVVPKPPYRMWRPMATLTAVEKPAEKPEEKVEEFAQQQASSEGMPEQKPVFNSSDTAEFKAEEVAEGRALAEKALSERATQEARARQEDINYKSSVTRAQTQAKKEDFEREMEKGVEFEQPSKEELEKQKNEAAEAMQGAKNNQEYETAHDQFNWLNKEWVAALKRPIPVPEVIPTPTPIEKPKVAPAPVPDFEQEFIHPEPELKAEPKKVEKVEPNEELIRTIHQLQEQVAELQKAVKENETKKEQAPVPIEKAPESHQAENAVRAATAEIFQKSLEPAWLEQQWSKVLAAGHDIASWWHSVGSKKAKDTLAKQDARIIELTKQYKEHADKSWMRTMIAPFTPTSVKLLWYQFRRKDTAMALEYHTDARKRHENERNELLNLTATRMDVELNVHEERAKGYQEAMAFLDDKLNAVYAKHLEASRAFPKASTVAEQSDIRDTIQFLEMKIKTMMTDRAQVEKLYTQANGEAARVQARKNTVLEMTQDVHGTVRVEAEPRRKLEVRKRTKSVESENNHPL